MEHGQTRGGGGAETYGTTNRVLKFSRPTTRRTVGISTMFNGLRENGRHIYSYVHISYIYIYLYNIPESRSVLIFRSRFPYRWTALEVLRVVVPTRFTHDCPVQWKRPNIYRVRFYGNYTTMIDEPLNFSLDIMYTSLIRSRLILRTIHSYAADQVISIRVTSSKVFFVLLARSYSRLVLLFFFRTHMYIYIHIFVFK